MDEIHKLMNNLSLDEKNDLDELFANMSLNEKEELSEVDNLTDLITKLSINETVNKSEKAIKIINKILQYLIILKNKVACYEKIIIEAPYFVY